MSTIILPGPGHEPLASKLAKHLGAVLGAVDFRRFPDGESYVRIASPMGGEPVMVVASLKDPDHQLPTLLFLADAAREMGASWVGLAAPYLAYMRQDQRFRDGEAVTSRTFATLIGRSFDAVATIDPHLHRYQQLSEIYSIPTAVARAAPVIAEWVRGHVKDGVVVGPDAESEQWAGEVARLAGLPYTILRKERRGDRDVTVAGDVAQLRGKVPVIVDDIISSGHTMAQAARLVRGPDIAPPIGIGIHAMFADGADALLKEAGFARVVTCNAIRHPTNAIDIEPQMAAAIAEVIGRKASPK